MVNGGGIKMNNRLLYLLLFLVLLSGCGMTAVQKQQVAQFGRATEAMGTVAETELVQIRQEIIQMNTENLILDSKQNDTKIELDKPVSPESALKRVAAAKALKAYGSLLNQLAIADRTEGIKKAAGDLVDNFDSALDQGLTAEQKEAASGLLVSLSNMWIEKMKKDSVKQIVTKYKNAVDKVADLLSPDFLAQGNGYLGGYTLVAGRLRNTAIGVLTQGQHPGFAERERALQAYVTAEKAIQKANEIDRKAQKAIEDLKKSNARLSEVIMNESYTTEDIKSYARSIQELVTMAQILTNK